MLRRHAWNDQELSVRKRIMKRAAILFLTSASIVSAAVGLLLWYHLRLANPCHADGRLHGEPVACYYHVYFFGLDDWPWVLAAALIYFACCIFVAWLSLKRGLSSRTG